MDRLISNEDGVLTDMGFLAGLPKAELHLHLEGTITPETWLRLIRRHEPASAVTVEDLRSRLRYRDLAGFLEVWMEVLTALRGPEDYRLAAREGALALARQNVWYAEFHTSIAGAHLTGRLNAHEIIPAIAEGLDEARREGGPEWRLIVDVIRDFAATGDGEVGLEIALRNRIHGVVALGLGGSEHLYPATAAREVFAAARTEGLRLTAHAGEAAGPKSIWQALEAGAERIGHAAHAPEDPVLVDHLLAHRIPLEMCPSSNVATGAVASLAAHPIGPFLRRGLHVTVNSDDPPLFHTDLLTEYRRVAETFHLDRNGLRRLARNAFEAAFLPEAEKAALLARLGGAGGQGPGAG